MPINQTIVNSRQTLVNFKNEIDLLYGDGAYLIFTWKKGKEASMPQKALVHIWFRTFAAHMLRKREQDVTKYDLLAMKISAKKRFYNKTHESFMIEEITDPFSPDQKRLEMTSIADWSQGDCYNFMTWLQLEALEHGLVLESKGEHQRLTQDSVPE